jgi:DNA recombination protein RmuC
MEYLLVACTFTIGFFIALIIGYVLRVKKQSHFDQTVKELILDKNVLVTQCSVLKETLRLKTDELESVQNEQNKCLVLLNQSNIDLAGTRMKIEYLTERLTLQKVELETVQKKLMSEFENVANRILKERSDDFSISNNKNLSEILNPLKERIQLFEKKVEDTYDKELRDKVSLREEVRKLTALNTQISQEAHNLTNALKGDVKKQGNWGEVILERVLERSGLTRGQEYQCEEVIAGVESNIQRPDVIIHLPEQKHIIIDSKVSLVAYERSVSAESELQRSYHLKEHISSIRSHVKLLSEKNYQNAQHLNTPDFVLMFVPIEASFSVAVHADGDLFSYAWERKIVIVSPTTLLATLRTISSIWKQENQTKNAQEIARLSGALYDKFIGFTEDMVKIRASIDKTSNAYDDAVKKMKEGNGNMIRTAEKIKELGAKTSTNRSLPSGFDVG